MSWQDDIYESVMAKRGVPRQSIASIEPKAIIRQSRKGPNKTERRFELECLEPWQKSIGLVGYQFEAMTLKLANGVRYTPDYIAYGIGAVRVYEVKGGFIREDAKIKLKFAAQQFHFFEFYLAQYTKGEWFINRVLP